MGRLLALTSAFLLLVPLSHAASDLLPSEETPYQKGDLVPVTCLNRTIDTGEHVIDSHGNLQYIPFPTCAETSRPLSLRYLIPGPQNCTITLTDALFHLLEFYVHNDAPLTCRIPTHLSAAQAARAPESAEAARAAIAGETGHGALGAESDRHVRMVVALGGTLQRSHLHVANVLNVVVHTSEAQRGVIDAATMYSVSPATRNAKIVIGDKLTLQFHMGWYEGDSLLGEAAGGGRGGGSLWLVWMLGVAVGVGVSHLWLLGVDGLPKSIRTFVVSRLPGRDSNVLPRYGGYGYAGGTANGDGFTGSVPKKD